MAHLWVYDRDSRPPWGILELAGEAVDLGLPPVSRLPGPSALLKAVSRSPDVSSDASIGAASAGTASAAGNSNCWVLFPAARANVQVNGLPVLTGLRVLNDRDEIRLGSAWVFFSTERLPRVETFTGSATPVSCPRCCCPIEIENGVPPSVVRCPGCDTLHHEKPDRNCWTHGEKCSICPQPTDLTAGYRWMPEDL